MSVYLKPILVFLILIGSTTPGALADDLGYGDSYDRFIRDSDAKRDYRRKRERDRRDDKRARKEERQEIDQHKDDYKKDYISDFVDTDFHKSRYGLDHLRDRLKDRKDSDRVRDSDRHHDDDDRDDDRDDDHRDDDDPNLDGDDHCFDDADYSYISDMLEKRSLEKRDAKEWKDLTTPIPGMLHDWVPARVDRLHNGAFEKEPDNGFPVPYRLNGHLDIQRKLPWDKDSD